MRRHQLLTAGLAVALAVGMGTSPALASGPGAGIRGEGRTAKVARVSVDVRQDHLSRGRLNYTSASGRFRVRCHGFDSYSQRIYIQPGPPAAIITADCVLERPRHKAAPVAVEAEFVDNSSFTRGARDEANLTFPLPDGERVSDRGRIRAGDVTVR